MYTVEDIARAVEDIVNHNKTYAEVEQYYNIPRSVVSNRIKGRHTPLEKLGSGRALSLSTEIEYDLKNCLQARARMGSPCSKEDVKTVVAEYVKSNNLKTPFVDGIPGDDWYYSFMGRHLGLSFKKPCFSRNAGRISGIHLSFMTSTRILQNWLRGTNWRTVVHLSAIAMKPGLRTMLQNARQLEKKEDPYSKFLEVWGEIRLQFLLACLQM